MNKMFEISKEDLSDIFNKAFDYKSNPNYNKDLDVNYNLKISKKDRGTEKEIKVKKEMLVCQKNCNKCKTPMDKVWNLYGKDYRCGRLVKRKTKIKVNIPREITDGQSIALIGEGKRKNNQFGNLLVTINVR